MSGNLGVTYITKEDRVKGNSLRKEGIFLEALFLAGGLRTRPRLGTDTAEARKSRACPELAEGFCPPVVVRNDILN
jgi:hypothetical protein